MKRFFWSSLNTSALFLAAASPTLACSAANQNDACAPDADGIISEPAEPILTVTDRGFMPRILATQNTSDITLTFENAGSTAHGFVVDCLPTPNSDGCPLESCFPSAARVEAIAPGEQAIIRFETPLVEGIYSFHSDLPEDSDLAPGQFVVQ